MPYGVDKELGGDSQENDAFMEKCVKDARKGGKGTVEAIKICKAQLRQKKEGDSASVASMVGTKGSSEMKFCPHCGEKL